MALQELKLDKDVQQKKALRYIEIDKKIGNIFDNFLADLESRISRGKEDPNIICRDTLLDLYLGKEYNYDEIIESSKASLALKTSVANFDSRNITLEAEYYDNIDEKKFHAVKPYIWLWMMFDRSPAGRNLHLGFPMRRLLAKKIFKKCGKNFKAFQDIELSFGYNISVGDNVVVHRKVLLDDRGEIIIEDGASISDYVNIYSHSHSIFDAGDVTLGKTIIHKGARLTYHSTVLSGVRVGQDSMVGAMGLVTRDVRNYHINVGIPAKSVRVKEGVCLDICTDKTCKTKGKPHSKH